MEAVYLEEHIEGVMLYFQAIYLMETQAVLKVYSMSPDHDFNRLEGSLWFGSPALIMIVF